MGCIYTEDSLVTYSNESFVKLSDAQLLSIKNIYNKAIQNKGTNIRQVKILWKNIYPKKYEKNMFSCGEKNVFNDNIIRGHMFIFFEKEK